MHAFVLSVGSSLPSGRLRETSSGPTPARDGITDSEEPSLQAELKKSFNIGKNNLRRGDNLPKSLKKIKKVRSDYELRGSSSQSLSQLL